MISERAVIELVHDCEDNLALGAFQHWLTEEEYSIGLFYVHQLLLLSRRWLKPSPSLPRCAHGSCTIRRHRTRFIPHPRSHLKRQVFHRRVYANGDRRGGQHPGHPLLGSWLSDIRIGATGGSARRSDSTVVRAEWPPRI